jgi:hypothetical protein
MSLIPRLHATPEEPQIQDVLLVARLRLQIIRSACAALRWFRMLDDCVYAVLLSVRIGLSRLRPSPTLPSAKIDLVSLIVEVRAFVYLGEFWKEEPLLLKSVRAFGLLFCLSRTLSFDDVLEFSTARKEKLDVEEEAFYA